MTSTDCASLPRTGLAKGMYDLLGNMTMTASHALPLPVLLYPYVYRLRWSR